MTKMKFEGMVPHHRLGFKSGRRPCKLLNFASPALPPAGPSCGETPSRSAKKAVRTTAPMANQGRAFQGGLTLQEQGSLRCLDGRRQTKYFLSGLWHWPDRTGCGSAMQYVALTSLRRACQTGHRNPGCMTMTARYSLPLLPPIETGRSAKPAREVQATASALASIPASIFERGPLAQGDSQAT